MWKKIKKAIHWFYTSSSDESLFLEDYVDRWKKRELDKSDDVRYRIFLKGYFWAIVIAILVYILSVIIIFKNG